MLNPVITPEYDLYEQFTDDDVTYLQSKGQTCTELIVATETLMMRLGAELKEVKAYLKDSDELFMAWVERELPRSHSYANKVMRSYEELGQTAPETLANLTTRAIFMLAQKNIDPVKRENALQQASSNVQSYNQTFLYARGQDEIVTRYESGDLGLKQAVSLTREIDKAPHEVQRLCLDHKVSSTEIVTYLTEIYDKRHNENSAWEDIAGHNGVLVNNTYKPLSQVNATDIDLYRQARVSVAKDAAIADRDMQRNYLEKGSAYVVDCNEIIIDYRDPKYTHLEGKTVFVTVWEMVEKES